MNADYFICIDIFVEYHNKNNIIKIPVFQEKYQKYLEEYPNHVLDIHNEEAYIKNSDFQQVNIGYIKFLLIIYQLLRLL
jgi:hypothetical protein